jgi:uncharacterized membrane protein YhiD involved in acid resistance
MLKKMILLAFFGVSAAWATENEVPAIDQRMNQLQKDIEQADLIEEKENVDAQRDMISNWGKYGQDMQKIKDIENKKKHLEQQIHLLEQRKSQKG